MSGRLELFKTTLQVRKAWQTGEGVVTQASTGLRCQTRICFTLPIYSIALQPERLQQT